MYYINFVYDINRFSSPRNISDKVQGIDNWSPTKGTNRYVPRNTVTEGILFKCYMPNGFNNVPVYL